VIPDVFGVWVAGALLGGLLTVSQLLKYLDESARSRDSSSFLRWLLDLWTNLLFRSDAAGSSTSSVRVRRIRVGFIALVVWFVAGTLYFRVG
jgi:hypothetical protein